jgi:hypothetical protein
MRVANFSWGLCATILVASSAQAGADEPFGALDDSPRFMLYVHKQVGTARHKSLGPSFGFAIERPTPLWGQADSLSLQPVSAKLFDLRYVPYDKGALFFNGLQLTGKPIEGLGWESYGGPNGPWFWGAAGLAALLIGLCATDNEPCSDDGGGGYSPPGE